MCSEKFRLTVIKNFDKVILKLIAINITFVIGQVIVGIQPPSRRLRTETCYKTGAECLFIFLRRVDYASNSFKGDAD